MDQLVELKNSRAELEANIAYLIKLEEQQYDFDNSEPIPPFAEPVTSNIVIKDSVTLIKPEYEYNIETFEVDSESLKGFVSIKNENIEKLKGLDIIGVYTVKNNETNSFYIGFTLDVEKSVREMFNNCVPTHPMMMKEYKESKIEDKSLLFEIKIKMVKTMSELLDAYLLFDKSFNGKFVHY